MAKGTVHLFCGLASSGKTTLAKELEEKHGAVRFTLDEWMIALTDLTIFDPEYGQMVERLKEMLWQTAVAILNQGGDVILDWSLWSRARRQKWVQRAADTEADYVLYYLNIPHVVLRERLRARNDALPAGAHAIPIDEFDRFLPLFEPPTEEENLNVIEMFLGQDEPIHNPHLDGGAFLLEGGQVGVLLLHGLTATAVEVRLLADELHDAGFTVSAPLLPGHGTHPDDLNDTTWHDWAWEAEMSYQYLATICDDVFVGGESTGAVLALHLARRHPEIAGVLCYAPAIKLALPLTNLISLYAAAPLVDSIPKKQMGSNPYWQGYRVYPLRGVLELVRLGRAVRRELADIEQPVLIVQGRHDETIDPESGDIILDGIASEMKEQYWMEKSGHIVLLENELPLIALLTRDFIQRALSAR